MLKAVIVDDEELARRGLELRLANFEDIEICAQSRNGREALAAVREHAPDLMFLDVQMPGMDGFDVLRNLSTSNMPAVIFVTAYDEFALKAFDANALDYLLKPVNDDRLAEAIDRARLDCDEKRANEHRSQLLKFVCDLTGQALSLEAALQAAAESGQRFPKRLAIRDGAETACVDVDAIDWIDAAGDYMCVHAGGKTHVLRGTMKHLEELLNPEVFVRVHRSAIVNRHRIRSMRPHRNGEYFLSLDGSTELKLSRKYKSNLDRIAHRSS
jgi:two-component system LytT family response regulator